MIIFRWICWLRGFHRSNYQLTFFDPPKQRNESGDAFGTTFPCETCGEFLPAGIHKNTYLKLEWRG